MANVTVIPATRNLHTKTPKDEKVRRRVAAYARVSTDSEEQLTSYEAQVDYYTKYIQANPDWDFVKVYTDEGISATNTKYREGFNTMIQDALDGKIDLIVTKSVSRFARNTVDSLTAVRKLREHGTEVFFEKENIWTLDSKGEVMITIMSSLAQEESRSISENVTWGQRKRFADGKVSLPYKAFLGYKKGENGLPEIVPEQAETVKLIYKMFMSGKTVHYIAKYLTDHGIPTPKSRSVWQTSTIESILTNEKYKGSAILQKKFTVDFLTKKMKVNEGEVPQYRVENSHPAIIDPAEWGMVQNEMAVRKSRGKHHNSLSPFSAKLVCGDCGEFFGSKVWHSTDKYRRVIWQCNGKFKGENKCHTPHIDEETIKRLFCEAVSILTKDRDRLLLTCYDIIDRFGNLQSIESQLAELQRESEVISGLMHKLIEENAGGTISVAEYEKNYEDYEERFDRVNEEYKTLRSLKVKRAFQVDVIECFMSEISWLGDLPISFSEKLWSALIDKVVIYHDERVEFVFKTGDKVAREM